MERERITISIKKPVLDQVDQIIDGTSVRNRSHAFETLALKALGTGKKTDAIIMLGGDEALKAIPAAETFIRKAKSIGVSEIIIATGFLGNKIKDQLGDGTKFGLKLLYSNEGEGTGGALAVLKNRLKNTFIVCNCDKEIKYDLGFLIKFHKEHNGTVTVATNNISEPEGIYVAEPEIFDYIEDGKFLTLEDDIFPILTKAGKLVIYPIN